MQDGGKQQKFCRPSCRRAFHAAGRTWSTPVGLAIACGYLRASSACAQTIAEYTLKYSEAYKRGDFRLAEAVARKGLDAEADQVGASSPDLIPFRRDLAMIEAANGRTSEAVEQLRSLISRAVARNYRSTLATLLVDLAGVLRDEGGGRKPPGCSIGPWI